MAEDRKTIVIKEGVNVAEEVVAIIAGLAATEVDGVNSLAGNLTNELISKAGATRLAKGVVIGADAAGDITVKVALNMDYGYEIPAVSSQVQEKVSSAIENMTGLKVKSVDVRIATVSVAN